MKILVEEAKKIPDGSKSNTHSIAEMVILDSLQLLTQSILNHEDVVLCCTALHCTALYSTALYSTALHCSVLDVPF